MGRATPLITCETLPPFADGVEVLFAEALLGFSTSSDRAWDTDARFLTVLINLSHAQEDRIYTRQISQAMRDVRCHVAVFTGAHWPSALEDKVLSFSPSYLNVIAVLPARDATSAASAASSLAAMTDGTHHQLGVAAVVAENTTEWGDLPVTGFAEAGHSMLGIDAYSLFRLLATSMSTVTLTCADEEDFLTALGTAETPSRLVQPLWVTGTQRLLFPDDADRIVAATASYLTVAPLWAEASYSELRNLMQAFRDLTRPDVAFRISATTGFFRQEQGLAGRSSPVAALCLGSARNP